MFNEANYMQPVPIKPAPDRKTRFSTIAEVSEALRISRMAAYRLVQSGELPAYRFGRCIRIPTSAVWAYISGSQIDPDNYTAEKAL